MLADRVSYGNVIDQRLVHLKTNYRAGWAGLSIQGIACMIVLIVLTMGSEAQSVPRQRPVAQESVNFGSEPVAFEVASIRKSQLDGTADAEATPNGYHAVNVPILRLVATAFAPSNGLSPYFEYTRVLGAPDWAKQDLYSIEAKVAASNLTEWQQPISQKAMLRSMLQALLVERCRLAVHRESKDASVYELVQTGKGPKLKEVAPGDEADLQLKHPGGIPLPGGGVLMNRNGQMQFFGVSIATFAEMLSTPAGRPVQDKTGLQSRYDFVLQLRDQGSVTDNGSSPESTLSIFTVLQEQLGLRLQPETRQVEMLVVDHIEKPSEN